MLTCSCAFWITGELVRLPKGASVPVTLKVLEYELFHFCPIDVSLSQTDFFFFAVAVF